MEKVGVGGHESGPLLRYRAFEMPSSCCTGSDVEEEPGYPDGGSQREGASDTNASY